MREAAEGIRARFGFGGEVEKPVPLEEVELRAARLQAPERFGDLFSDERYERVSHALGKAYRDVVQGFYGASSRTRRTWSPSRATSRRSRRC